jgi:hypothetical protein
MTDQEASILARLRRLRDRGRRPEMTCGDAAVVLGIPEDAARDVLSAMSRRRVLKSNHRCGRGNQPPTIYWLPE